ncbi:cHAP domain-containing protein [Clostridium sp. CAG:967]|nr:cHAP domain-containing protein [Clostridium sp. CAG:967]
MSLLKFNLNTGNTNYLYSFNSKTGSGGLSSYGSTGLFNLYNTLYAPQISNKNTIYRTNTSYRLSGNMGKDIVSNAKQYIGFNEADNSYKLFTQGRNEAWCADFVTHVVKEAYKKNGKSIPSGFGSSSVEGLRQWGKNNNCYLDTTNTSNKSSVIANSVKPGDVVIFKNGISHTGVVAEVNSDGTFKTIEGNTSDKVAYRNYSANDSKISGFVQLA